MIKFSSEQLLVLQRALTAPIPPLAPPPSMVMMAAAGISPPPPQQQQPTSAAPQQPRHRAQARAAPPDDALLPLGAARPALLPLAPLAWAYLAVANAVAVSSVASPEHTIEGALLASPLLSLALALHSLALLDASLAASCLGLACALGVPAALGVASLYPEGSPSRPLAPWLCCAALAAFFSASAPRGALRCLSAAGALAVLAAGAASASTAYQRAAWGAAVVALSIQSAISAGRLRGHRLHVCAVAASQQGE
jgi:hypothetical protein